MRFIDTFEHGRDDPLAFRIAENLMKPNLAAASILILPSEHIPAPID